MAFEKLTNSINDLNDNVRDLAKSGTEYYKLDLYKKIIKGVISLVNMMLLGFICLIVLLFISIALALLISHALGIPSAGFFIIGAFYLLIFILIWFFGKKHIEKIILIKSSRTFFND
ncbi:phage holin family protein [Gillisia hiemivivida]|jgi:ABC-type multidrug transport system fused ATPase/permease subunit|uniref:Phage holin family protein n=1 Tax=Gillisia hiemivivida TaxID=291190 RepID=A0A5C6ZX02_9FLAO|nr:phage holin family protein [Gillisia hiemivivida]TXD95533.1 phage holin family protein [Gillisia hiemivivida]